MNILIINQNREFLAPSFGKSGFRSSSSLKASSSLGYNSCTPPIPTGFATQTPLICDNKSWCIVSHGMFALREMDIPNSG